MIICRKSGERAVFRPWQKKLNRSVEAVKNRSIRIGLGRFLDSGDYVTYSRLMEALYGIEEAGSAYRLHKRADFPIRKKKVNKNSFRIVYIDEFWEWAKENKRFIDFSKMEENILGAEPEWVKRKRKIDFACRVKMDPWTSLEDAKLKRMLSKHEYTYTDLAAELNRTEGAVKRRIFDLNLKEKPKRNSNRPWTDEEVKILTEMYEEGWSFEKIGAKLKRSALGCRGKIERIEHPEYTLSSYRNRAKEA